MITREKLQRAVDGRKESIEEDVQRAILYFPSSVTKRRWDSSLEADFKSKIDVSGGTECIVSFMLRPECRYSIAIEDVDHLGLGLPLSPLSWYVSYRLCIHWLDCIKAESGLDVKVRPSPDKTDLLSFQASVTISL